MCYISDCMHVCPNRAHMLSEAVEKNDDIDPHEQSGSHKSTRIHTKPAKLFIKAPPHIISERRWYAASVNGLPISKNIMIFAFLTASKCWKKKIRGHFQAGSHPSATHIDSIDISQLLKSIKGMYSRNLMAFQCSGCRFSSIRISIDDFNETTQKLAVDHHKACRRPIKDQVLDKTCETFRRRTTYYYI